ncbi:hypothetical protein FANTH_8515 [Fusarium anthophilum]|uniref:Secreted protein n=1 Tax=Fusarium anthophilum TaxID=48485 RepID=A0A8H5E0J4_9HYPO|nr:hypothetical protein FANTH_8515 [Fusarium anthophilum]
MRLQFLFFLPVALAWWNCELPIGAGDNGRCVDGVTGNWDACSAVCVPLCLLLLSTANIHCVFRVTLAEATEMGAVLRAPELRTVHDET